VGRRDLSNERIAARADYVDGHLTNLETLALKHNVSVPTIRKWRDEENWPAQRSKKNASPVKQSQKILKLLSVLLEQMEDKIENEEHVSDELIKRVDKYSQIIKRLDGMFDVHGNMLIFMDELIELLAETPGHMATLQAIQSILPQFHKRIESKY